MEPDNKPRTDDETNSLLSKAEFTVHRRSFLLLSVIAGTATTSALSTYPPVADYLEPKLNRDYLSERLSSELLKDRKSALRTAIESVVVFAGNVLAGAAADKLHVPHGGHAGDGALYEEQITEAPLFTSFRDSLVVPIIEEALFRLLPSIFIDDKKRNDVQLHWEVGLTANLVFGAIHNVSKQNEESLTIHLNSLPLEQLILGAYCWYAQRMGGFVHAAGAHVLYNNLCNLYANYFEGREQS